MNDELRLERVVGPCSEWHTDGIDLLGLIKNNVFPLSYLSTFFIQINHMSYIEIMESSVTYKLRFINLSYVHVWNATPADVAESTSCSVNLLLLSPKLKFGSGN